MSTRRGREGGRYKLLEPGGPEKGPGPPDYVTYVFVFLGKGNGKAIALQAWTDPEGSRRLRFPDFKTIGT